MTTKTTPLERRMLAFVVAENAEGRKPSASAVAAFDSYGTRMPSRTKATRHSMVTRLCIKGLLADDGSSATSYAMVITEAGHEVLK